MKKELKAIYDGAKSFYKKAYTIDGALYSYATLIATIDENGRVTLNKNVTPALLFSHTTLRHLKEYLKQHFDLLDVKDARQLKNANFSKKMIISLYY